MGCERLGRGVDRTEVGPARLTLGRPHAKEVDLTEVTDLGERHGEPEPAGFQVLPQQRFQAGFEERGLALRCLVDLLRVDVDRQHLVPEVRHADGVDEAEVSGPDDGDPRQLTTPSHGRSLTMMTSRTLQAPTGQWPTADRNGNSC